MLTCAVKIPFFAYNEIDIYKICIIMDKIIEKFKKGVYKRAKLM